MIQKLRIAIMTLLLVSCSLALSAQVQTTASLPGAPSAVPPLYAFAAGGGVGQMPASAPAAPSLLTRQQAEQMALKSNPRIRVSELLAKAQHEVVRETRSNELPSLYGNATAVQAQEASRISAGYLTASSLFEHAGLGVQLSQLITDFGRSQSLVSSAKLREKARQADAEASREDIVLATDQAFFDVLEAQATLKVAQQTVASRQTLVDQVSALTSAKLKSDLDLSFAQVNLSQARLLQLGAQGNLDAARASLSAVLGYDRPMDFQLVEEPQDFAALPPDANSLIAVAMQNRPDLQSLQYDEQAARKFSTAQKQQLLPTISALGVVGKTPVGASQYFTSDWYGAVGVNLSVPIFNGFRYTAQASEAAYQAQAATERTRDLRDLVVRDVRTAWLNANTALQRVTVTGELLKQANTALDLSRTRYQLGLSSIVELSQAQLQQTEAAIADANARSQYGFALSVLQFQTGVHP